MKKIGFFIFIFIRLSALTSQSTDITISELNQYIGKTEKELNSVKGRIFQTGDRIVSGALLLLEEVEQGYPQKANLTDLGVSKWYSDGYALWVYTSRYLGHWKILDFNIIKIPEGEQFFLGIVDRGGSPVASSSVGFAEEERTQRTYLYSNSQGSREFTRFDYKATRVFAFDPNSEETYELAHPEELWFQYEE